jgi:hypothetical protein
MQLNWNNPAGNHSATIKAHVGKPVCKAIHGSGNMFPEERLSWPLHNTSIRFQGMGIVSHLVEVIRVFRPKFELYFSTCPAQPLIF